MKGQLYYCRVWNLLSGSIIVQPIDLIPFPMHGARHVTSNLEIYPVLTIGQPVNLVSLFARNAANEKNRKVRNGHG